MHITPVPLTSIDTGAVYRPIDTSEVKNLAESFLQIGQLSPIGIGPGSKLVFGRHRYEAAKLLKWDVIDAVFIDEIDPKRAELMTIAENLFRAELSTLQQSNQLARYNELLEKLGMRSKQGGDRRSEQSKSHRETLKTPVELASERGISKQTLYRQQQIGTIVPEAQQVLFEHGLDNSTTKLLEVAKQPKEEQLAMARDMAQKKAKLQEIGALRKKASHLGYKVATGIDPYNGSRTEDLQRFVDEMEGRAIQPTRIPTREEVLESVKRQIDDAVGLIADGMDRLERITKGHKLSPQFINQYLNSVADQPGSSRPKFLYNSTPWFVQNFYRIEPGEEQTIDTSDTTDVIDV